MSRKYLTEFVIKLIFLGIITYFAFTTSVRVLWIVTPILWSFFLGDFSTMMLLYSAGITPKRTQSNLLTVFIWLFIFIIDFVIVYLLFKNKVFLILLLNLFPGVAIGVRKIRFAYLERSGKSKTRLEEVKVYLIVELWFLLLLWTLKCGEISWSKW